MPEKDPLTKCYEGLWSVLEASNAFTALVPARCRVKYTDAGAVLATRYPERDARQPDKYPQVAIVAEGGPTDTYWSSDGTRVGAYFQIWVRTGDRRLCYLQDGIYQGVFPVQWAILRAMMNWKAVLAPLTWGGVAGFITHCAPDDRKEKIEPPRTEEQKAPFKDAGWTLAWQGKVDMWFQSSTLLPT